MVSDCFGIKSNIEMLKYIYPIHCKHVISIFAEYWLIIVLCSLSKCGVEI